jgi:hypothetical protein
VLSEAAVLVVMTAALPWLTALVGSSRRSVVLVSALLGHFAWHQLIEDGAALWQSEWPPPETIVLLSGRSLAFILIAVGAGKAVARWFERSWSRRAGERLTS